MNRSGGSRRLAVGCWLFVVGCWMLDDVLFAVLDRALSLFLLEPSFLLLQYYLRKLRWLVGGLVVYTR